MRLNLISIFAVPFFLLAAISSNGQTNSVSIGTSTIHYNAVLWLESISGNQGFVIPVGNRNNVASPAKGMLIFDTDQIYFHDGSTWNALGGGTSQGKTYSLSVNATNQLVLSDGTNNVTTTVPIAGDVTGTSLGNTTVSRILGKQISISSFPSTGIQNLAFDGTTGTWKLQAASSGSTPTLSNGQILTGDGTTNSATTLSGDAALAAGVLKVTGLQGSALPSLSSTSFALNLLSYNATTGKWEFKDPTGANLMLKTIYDPNGKAADVFDLTSHSGVLGVANGGTGLSQTPTNNQLLIGNTSNGFSLSTLTAGTGINISNTSGTLTISSSGSGSLSLTTLGNSGAATLVGSVLNVPAYTLAGLGGISLSSLSASAPLTYNNLTGAFSITPATNLTDGYLTKTDWATFNGKQGAITFTTTGTSGAATLVGNTLNIPQYQLTESDPTVKAISGIVKSNGATISAAVAGTDYQAPLVSGTNIKTINGASVLGSGNITAVTTESDPVVKAISGIVKSNGTTISAALSGTDYLPITGGTGVTTLGIITTGTWNGTKISEAFGGTNQSTYTTGDVLYASAANTLSKLGIGTAGQVLTVSGGVPTWQTVSGTGTVTNVTGTLPISVANNSTTPAISISLANASTNGYLSSADWNIFNGKQGTISLTTTGSSGAATFASNTLNVPNYTLAGLGGISLTSLSATAPLNYNSATGGFSIANAAADGTTKGAASFATNDFDATSGNISLDYTNGQAASSTTKGFLTSADWTTFNGKQGTISLTTTGSSGAATLVGNTLNIPNYAGTTYTAGAGLTLAANTFSVNTSQNISTLTNLITKGLVTTTALGALGSTQGTGFLKDNGTGTISYDNSTYLTGNQTITLSGDVTGSGTTAITTAIGASKVTNTMLAGSIAASKLIGTDINTVGTITSGTWNGTKISEAYGGTNQTTYAIGDILYASAANTLSKLAIGTNSQVLTISGGVPTWQNSAGGGWGLTGNAGTVDGTNFIGTTDNIPFNIKVNNQKAGRIEAATPFSTFYGYQAGMNSTSQANTAIGYQALTALASSSNTAVGYQAMQNTNSGQNTALGANSLTANTSGTANTAIGQGVLSTQTAGNYNTGVGTLALNFNTGSSNAALGMNAAAFNSSGSNNVFVGYQAGYPNANVTNANTTGSNNTFIGSNSGPGTSTALTNATAIGANSTVSTSNTIQLGDGLVTTVNVGTGTTATLVAGGLQVTGGTLAAGNVLTSDASGNATWQAAGAGSGWSLTGNGTVTAANFLGSTNDIPLTFKVNNQKAGYIDNATGAAFNTYFGYQAGNAITTGISNSFFGYQVGKPTTTGSNNAGFGKFALTNNTTGSDNAAFGYNALLNNTTASSNTALGRSALFTMNFAAGQTNNTAVGYQALYSTNPTSSSDGKMNSSIGYNSGYNITTGTYNTFLGASADASSGTLTNATAIGAQAYVAQSNSLVLGSISGVNGATANTNVGIGTNTPATELQVTHGNGSPSAGNGLTIQNAGPSNQNFSFFVSNSTGNLNLYDNNTFVGGFAQVSGTYTPVSDRRYKKNIQPLESILPKLSEIQIRRYHFKKQNDNEPTNIGVIAQELKEIFPELVKYSPENDRYTVDYLSMGPVAIKAIQEQQQLIKNLLEKIQTLETKLDKEQADKTQLQSQVDQLSNSIEQIKRSLGLDLKAKK